MTSSEAVLETGARLCQVILWQKPVTVDMAIIAKPTTLDFIRNSWVL